MNQPPQKFEDRKGSNFEMGKDRSTRPSSNEITLVNRKEDQQRKKMGIKPTDTNIEVANIIARNMLAKVIKEEPSQDANQSTQPDDDFDEEEKKKEDKIFDPKEELRIKMMQYLNPRILKSKELKDYMKRTNVNEAIAARLNELATEKLDLYKKAIAINAPVEINERIKENKIKKDNVTRQIGAHAYIQGVRKNIQSAKMGGRDVMSDPEISSQQVSNLYRKLPNPLAPMPPAQDAEELRQQHYTLHEETEQFDEASLAKLAADHYKHHSSAEYGGEAGYSEKQIQRHREKAGQILSNISKTYGEDIAKAVKKHSAHATEIENASAGYVDKNFHKNFVDAVLGGIDSKEHEKYKSYVSKEGASHHLDEEVEQLDEAKKRNPNVIKQGRTKIVKARVRGGKVQRRKRVSAVKGFTVRGGKLKRMSMAERIRRKRGQRIGKMKRKAKMARALMRRKRSMRRRASLGLKE